jgi:hypothetical protein
MGKEEEEGGGGAGDRTQAEQNRIQLEEEMERDINGEGEVGK